MVFTKKVTKAPAVMVETKKLSAKDTCDMWCCGKMRHLLVPVLLVINLLLLVWLLSSQLSVEVNKVWGRANYRMVQQIYKSPIFRAQQKQQIEQALQQYQGTAQQAVQQPAQQAVQQVPTTAKPAVTQ